MAENKKSFLLYCDLLHTVEELTNEEAGKLFKHILNYVNDKNPQTTDRIIRIAFEPIKQVLKRDLVKYEQIREKKRQAGIASAESRKQNQQVLTGVGICQQEATDSTVNVNVNDSVNVNVINKDIVEKWNTTCSPPLPKIKSLTDSRKKKIKIRLKEIGSTEKVYELFDKISKSKFLNGDNPRGWMATFDWVFENDKNWLKIMEGSYDSSGKETSGNQPKYALTYQQREEFEGRNKVRIESGHKPLTIEEYLKSQK